MLRKTITAFSLSLLIAFPAVAAVPYTFTNGTPANASEINANFTALSDQIAALQAQVTALQAFAGAPTVASLAGTYDLFEVSIDVDQNGPPGGYGVAGSSTSGTVVLNANGTGTVNTTHYYRQLSMFDSPMNVGNSSNNGWVPIDSTSVQLNNTPETENLAITWTLSGGVVTVITGDGDVSLVVAGGKILMSGINDSEGQNGLTILVRR